MNLLDGFYVRDIDVFVAYGSVNPSSPHASEYVMSMLVTGTTATTFSSFEKVSQLTVKECILNSAPKSCELDPIPSKLLIECLDSILPSLTDLFNSSLASGIFPQCFKSRHTYSQKEVS